MLGKIRILALGACLLLTPLSSVSWAEEADKSGPGASKARLMAAETAVINQDEIDAYLKAVEVFVVNKNDQPKAWAQLSNDYFNTGERVILFSKIPNAVLMLKKDATEEEKAQLAALPPEEKPSKTELDIVRKNLPALEKALAELYSETK
ncbi:hypothetical protein LJB99_00675 [Deltaproteobacteria bacterium OttesenSCG-928-K17]|nr:hypothetical protein [Deltaproteobacteria bacterium OttesenSCG-928-K17]